jgi:hypothetical protein
LYPFFTKVIEFKETGTISLNNFESIKNKNGLEYLCSNSGKLLEIRNWKNNLLNGNVFSYATNANIKMLGNYVNDTLCNYYELDTLNGNILFYEEKIKSSLGITDNQIIYFKDGKIDENRSYYYVIKPYDKGKYKIFILGKKDFPNLKIVISEINENKFLFESNINSEIIEMNNSNVCTYIMKNSSAKYLSGYIENYRYLTDQEVKEQGLEKGQTMGRLMYFKWLRSE